jgi:hypothetical protein
MGAGWATALTIVLLLSVVGGLVLGLRGQRRRGGLVLLLLPLPFTLGIVLSGAFSSFRTYGNLPGLQGRYLYLGVAGLALAAAVAWDRVLGRSLPLVAVALVLLLQGLQGREITRSLWLANDHGSLRTAVHGLEVVSPWSHFATTLVFVLTALTALAALVLAARGAFRPIRPAESVAA